MANPPNNIGYVVAGYSITAAAVVGYAGSLFARARRARRRVAALARRRGAP